MYKSIKHLALVGFMSLAVTLAGLQNALSVNNAGDFVFESSVYRVQESQSTLEITVNREQGSTGAVSVVYSTKRLGEGVSPFAQDIDFSRPGDYDGTFNTLNFAHGETSKTFTVTIFDDLDDEGDETFGLRLLDPSGGAQLGASSASSATVIIVDDDKKGPGNFVFESSQYRVQESQSTLEITVNREQGSTGAVSVVYSTKRLGEGVSPFAQDIDFSRPGDYDGTFNTLNFAHGEASKTFTVTIFDDLDDEGDETFGLRLLDPSGGAQLGASSASSATVIIVDDDKDIPSNSPPSISITSPPDGSGRDANSRVRLTATANDNEDGSLDASILWSSSIDGSLGNGATVNALLSPGKHTIQTTVVDSGNLSTSTSITLQIITTDAPPSISIIAPIGNTSQPANQATRLTATANDTRDGDLGNNIEWSSDRDGALGTGNSLSVQLTIGKHLITASVADSSNQTAEDNVTYTLVSDTGPVITGSLSEKYPGDVGIAFDDAVLFFDDFETGWGRWDRPTGDTQYLTIENDSRAHAGERFLRSTVTFDDLKAKEFISSSTQVNFNQVDEIYWRFYARFPTVAPNPHHWVRVAAGDREYNSSGLANTVPGGSDGFWFDFDTNNEDVMNFYVYWQSMRSGNCNDGSTTPGCAGDQGHKNYFGNIFRPEGQQAFKRDEWFCIEIHAKSNSPGSSDGELGFYINDQLVGKYGKGFPEGKWLRSTFHEGDSCKYSSCPNTPSPFEGFDFRSTPEVGFKSLFLDAYYERGSAARKKAALEATGLTVVEEQTIFYDNVVAATRRIGCRR
ncbi:hypothetical protein MNBD_GAMMA08-1205 [hydrothermal vent metagenome]|uniref:Calx-beta domain-containing protein n=1 Tax=hydrothermal vent metagenome TaxID=652676 RepID=A0A3B0XUB8_9ZZZZ